MQGGTGSCGGAVIKHINLLNINCFIKLIPITYSCTKTKSGKMFFCHNLNVKSANDICVLLVVWLVRVYSLTAGNPSDS